MRSLVPSCRAVLGCSNQEHTVAAGSCLGQGQQRWSEVAGGGTASVHAGSCVAHWPAGLQRQCSAAWCRAVQPGSSGVLRASRCCTIRRLMRCCVPGKAAAAVAGSSWCTHAVAVWLQMEEPREPRLDQARVQGATEIEVRCCSISIVQARINSIMECSFIAPHCSTPQGETHSSTTPQQVKRRRRSTQSRAGRGSGAGGRTAF